MRSIIVTDTRAPRRQVSAIIAREANEKLQRLADAQGKYKSTLIGEILTRYLAEAAASHGAGQRGASA